MSPTWWPKRVIEALEVIDVDHEHGQGSSAAFGARHFQVELLLEVAAGLESGEEVGEGKAQQRLIGVVAGQHAFGDQGEDPKELGVFAREAVCTLAEQLQ